MILPDNITLILFFIFGSIIGSFLNVVIWRIPRQESIVSPPSHCPSCNNNIAPYDNIPLISWLILRGKCRHCDVKISSRYFFVELITGLLTLLMVLKFGLSSELIIKLILVYMLISIAYIDYDHYIIPNEFILMGFILLIPSHFFGWLPIEMLDGVYGALTFSGFLYFIGQVGFLILKKDSMGFGDVKLGLIIGGVFGLKLSVLALFLSFIISALFTIIGISLFKMKVKGEIPFGPFMAAATIVIFLTRTPGGGNSIINWYFTTMF